MDLFMENSNGASFSECRKYRYSLWRIWDVEKPMVMFIGLNPSTANENGDDPTIRRVKKFAFDWGFGGVYMMNLFAWVTAYPEELKQAEDPIGGANDFQLRQIGKICNEIIFAWGSFPEAIERAEEVKAMFPGAKALLVNSNGSPRHPLYVPQNTKPVIYG
jgi:hypothetical protein